LKPKFKYLRRKRGRAGDRERLYYEEPGKARIPLRGPVGSPAFLADYEAATKAAPLPKQERTQPYTLAALVHAYEFSQHFRTEIRSSTQEGQRRIMKRLVDAFGAGDVRTMRKGDVAAIVESLSGGPCSSRNLLKVLSQLLKLAVRLEWRDDNPVRDMERPKAKGTRHCWSDTEIAAFKEHWPVGTRQRLALDLLLFTGQRKGDIVRLTHENLRGGRLRITQEKTGVEVDAPLAAELRASIAATPTGLTAVLVSSWGRPYGSKAFCGVFKDWTRAAGLPDHCSAHGLRKAFARTMAENGATAHEIMAAGGWTTLTEVERYTRAANRSRLADSGLAKVSRM
jgi:integrase